MVPAVRGRPAPVMLTSTGAVSRSTTSCRTSGADLYTTIQSNSSTECKHDLLLLCALQVRTVPRWERCSGPSCSQAVVVAAATRGEEPSLPAPACHQPTTGRGRPAQNGV